MASFCLCGKWTFTSLKLWKVCTMYCCPAIEHKSNEYDDKHEECDLCTTTQQCSPPAHLFMHNCKVMRQNHNQNLEPDLYPWCSLFLPAHTNTHFTLCKNHNPRVKKAHNISRNTLRFHPNDKGENKTPTEKEKAHSLFFTTLSEAGVEGPGPVRIQAICDWLQAQVNHLVQTELAAVNGGSLGFQGNEELLRTVWRHQTSLEEKRGQGKSDLFCMEVSWLTWNARWGSF